jgi:heavy metal efflux system protein
MIDAIISFSLRQRVFVLLAAAGLLTAGLWSTTRLPIDAVPDITNIQVQINTEVKGLAPEEIEKLVTYPLEMEMFGVPGMIELRSLSKFGLSQITLVFEEGTDIYRARQLVSERLQNAVDGLRKTSHPSSRRSPPASARSTTTWWIMLLATRALRSRRAVTNS